MIRPPSLQRTYDDFFSGDEALRRGATPEEKTEIARLIKVARETGDWRPLAVEGKQPTKFTFKPLSGDVYRTMVDMLTAREIGAAKMPQIAFRAAFSAVSNLGIDLDADQSKKVNHPKLGELASTQLTDLLDGCDVSIVTELGGEVLRRAQEVSPKS